MFRVIALLEHSLLVLNYPRHSLHRMYIASSVFPPIHQFRCEQPQVVATQFSIVRTHFHEVFDPTVNLICPPTD